MSQILYLGPSFHLIESSFLNGVHQPIEKNMAFHLIYNILVYPLLLHSYGELTRTTPAPVLSILMHRQGEDIIHRKG